MIRYTVNCAQLEARAEQLRARYLGGGVFMVQSGSLGGFEYQVDADPHCDGEPAPLEEWRCGCRWSTAGDHGAPGTGRLCSHVRAAGQMMQLARQLAPLAHYAAAPRQAAAR
jgi:hypothetical protein